MGKQSLLWYLCIQYNGFQMSTPWKREVFLSFELKRFCTTSPGSLWSRGSVLELIISDRGRGIFLFFFFVELNGFRLLFSRALPPVVPFFQPKWKSFSKQLSAFVNTAWHLENTGKETLAQAGFFLPLLWWNPVLANCCFVRLEEGAKSILSVYCVAWGGHIHPHGAYHTVQVTRDTKKCETSSTLSQLHSPKLSHQLRVSAARVRNQIFPFPGTSLISLFKAVLSLWMGKLILSGGFSLFS